jgi:NAD-dependent dihydropyrimidine dehydrogenase PreA subunit
MPPKGRIVVNELFCKGCSLCVEFCPQGVLELGHERLTAKGVGQSWLHRLRHMYHHLP